jgi:hypothetical protein
VAATPGPRAWLGGPSTLERCVIVGLKRGEGGIEHFPARHDDDVVTGGHLVAPEDLSREALGAVAFHGAAKLARGGHAQSGGRVAVDQNRPEMRAPSL